MKTEDNITMSRNEFKELITGLMDCSKTDKGQTIEEIVADNLVIKLAHLPTSPFDNEGVAIKRRCEHIRQQIFIANTILKHWDK